MEMKDLPLRRLLLAAVLVVSCSADRADQRVDDRAPPLPEQSAAPAPEHVPPTKDAEAPPPGPCFTSAMIEPKSSSSDVVVTIHPNEGPHGASPAKVDRRLYGTSIADWRPNDYAPNPNPTFLAYLKALRPGVLRWPAGHRSQEYIWERGGGDQHGDFTLTAAHIDAFIALAKAVSAEPLFAINVKRGSPGVAASLVRYLNVEKGYGVRFFQIGNEPDLTDGITQSPSVYAADLVRFVDAMRAVDPNIRIIGPELLTGAHVGGIHKTTDWMTPILAETGKRINGISWHYYPLDSGQPNPSSSAIVSVPHLFQESASDWPPAGMSFVNTIMPTLATLRDTHAPGAEIWVTEFAEDPGPAAGTGISDIVAGALWSIDALGRYAEHAPGAVLRWIFQTVEGHGYGLLDGQHRPRASYAALWLHARHVGDRYVRTETSALTKVAAHAAFREDGALTLVLVNKTEEEARVHVDLGGHCVSGATSLTFEGDGLTSKSFRIEGKPFDEATATNGLPPTPIATDALFDTVLPKTSIRVIGFSP